MHCTEVFVDSVERIYWAMVVFVLLIIFWWLVNKAEKREERERIETF